MGEDPSRWGSDCIQKLLTVLGHVCVVAIIITACLCALVGSNDVSTPEKEAVHDEGADLV